MPLRWRIALLTAAAIAISYFDRFGYGVVFAIVSTLHVIAFLVIVLSVRRVQPVISEGTR